MNEQKRKRGRPRLDTHLTEGYGGSRRKAVNAMYMMEAVGVLTEAASEIPSGGLLWTSNAKTWTVSSKNGILEQLGRLLVQDGFAVADFIYAANLAVGALKAGCTTREIENAIRAIRLAFKAADANPSSPAAKKEADHARAVLERMAAYEEGAAND